MIILWKNELYDLIKKSRFLVIGRTDGVISGPSLLTHGHIGTVFSNMGKSMFDVFLPF